MKRLLSSLRVLAAVDARHTERLVMPAAGNRQGTCEFDLTHRLDSAVQRLRESTYDVVLLQLELPDSSGVQTYLTLARFFPRVPVVVLADADHRSSANEALDCGACDCLFVEQLQPDVLSYCLRCAAQRQQLQLADEQLVEVQLDEQRRLARELHDGMVQSLSSMRLRLQMTARQSRSVGGAHTLMLDNLADEAIDVLNDVRRLARGLHPAIHQSRRLDQAICKQAELIRRETGVRIHVTSQYSGRLKSNAKQNLFRIFQESVENAVRHGDAKNVAVQIRVCAGQLNLEIADDGKGFDYHGSRPQRDGLGLTSIHERAELLGGTATIRSSNGAGATISVSVPLEPNFENQAAGRSLASCPGDSKAPSPSIGDTMASKPEECFC